jgi:hypothetical protein
VREKVLNQDILLKFISNHDQVADLFTKGLPSAQFLALKSKLFVVPTPHQLEGGGGGVKGYQARRRSCRKAETQNGKIHYVLQPHLSARQVTLAVYGRKETQPLAALDNKQKIFLSLM